MTFIWRITSQWLPDILKSLISLISSLFIPFVPEYPRIYFCENIHTYPSISIQFHTYPYSIIHYDITDIIYIYITIIPAWSPIRISATVRIAPWVSGERTSLWVSAVTSYRPTPWVPSTRVEAWWSLGDFIRFFVWKKKFDPGGLKNRWLAAKTIWSYGDDWYDWYDSPNMSIWFQQNEETCYKL